MQDAGVFSFEEVFAEDLSVEDLSEEDLSEEDLSDEDLSDEDLSEEDFSEDEDDELPFEPSEDFSLSFELPLAPESADPRLLSVV